MNKVFIPDNEGGGTWETWKDDRISVSLEDARRAVQYKAHAEALAEALHGTAHDIADAMLWIACPDSTPAEKLLGIEAVLRRTQPQRKQALANWEGAK